MSGEHIDGYVLFLNHTDGMRMYRYLKEQGITVRISPVPRSLSVCCGMSLLVLDADMEALQQVVADSGITYDRVVALPRQLDPNRDVYC